MKTNNNTVYGVCILVCAKQRKVRTNKLKEAPNRNWRTKRTSAKKFNSQGTILSFSGGFRILFLFFSFSFICFFLCLSLAAPLFNPILHLRKLRTRLLWPNSHFTSISNFSMEMEMHLKQISYESSHSGRGSTSNQNRKTIQIQSDNKVSYIQLCTQ